MQNTNQETDAGTWELLHTDCVSSSDLAGYERHWNAVHQR